MEILYKNTKLEHSSNEIKTDYVFISTSEIAIPYEVKLVSPENLEGVVRLYKEHDRADKKKGRAVIVCVTCETYLDLVQIAQSCKAGILFVNESNLEGSTCIASTTGYSSYELDKFAAEIGVQIDIKRFVMSIAREVPFSISREDAQEIFADVAGYGSVQSLEFLDKVLDNDVITYKRLKQVTLDQGVVQYQLAAKRPGPQATAELQAYAEKIYNEGGVHVLEAGLGFGKTQHAIRPILLKAKAEGKKSTLLTHRIAISKTFEDICSQYENPKIFGREHELESMSLVVNSASQQRFKLHTEASDVLIIDEGSQVIAHILQKGFLGDRHAVFHELLKLIKKARLVLIADAFVSDILMKFVALAGRSISFTSGKTDNSQNEIALAEISTAQRMIIEDIAAGKKVMVGLDSRQEAEAMKALIEKQGMNVLLVTRNTRNHQNVLAFFRNPNAEVKKYDAIVFSPSMQSSISITDVHFESHYCLFFGMIGVDDAKQFTRRDRTNKKVVVGVSRQIRSKLDKSDLINELFASDDYLFDRVALPYYKAEAKEKNNFRTNIALAFEFEGYNVTRIEPSSADEIAFTTFTSEKRAVKEYVVSSTMTAAKNIIETGDFDKVSILKSEQDRFHNDALQASKILGKLVSEMNEDDIKFFNGGGGAVKLMNARCCLLNELDFKTYATNTEVSRGIDHKALKGRRAFFLKFMSTIGIDNGNEILTFDAMKAAAELVVKYKDSLLGYGIISKTAKCKTAHEVNATINAVLKSLGLSKVRVRAFGQFAYKLSKPAFMQVLSYIDQPRFEALSKEATKIGCVENLDSLIIISTTKNLQRIDKNLDFKNQF